MTAPRDLPRPDTLERPGWACLLHRAPSNGTSWKLADQGYRTCEACLIKLRDVISDIRTMYGRLDATPGAFVEVAEGGGMKGFESKPAASPHIVSMRDVRSKSYEVAVEGFVYEKLVYDPDGWILKPLPAGVQGPQALCSYSVKREVWFGADGRGHSEQERPPRSVPKALSSLGQMIAEEWGHEPPTGTVEQLCHWLDVSMEFCTRQDWIRDVDEELRSLKAQLKPVTGEGRKHRILSCPNTLDKDTSNARTCGANLYEPDKHGIITCHACKREWPQDKWRGSGPEFLYQVAEDDALIIQLVA